MATLQLKVDGVWLSSIAGWGDIEWSDNEHGSDSMSWGMTSTSAPLLRGAKDVKLYYGAKAIWGGQLDTPDRDGGEFTAVGYARLAEGAKALTGGGVGSSTPNTVVDAAITRGLPWTRIDVISATAQSTDLLGEVPTVAEVLDVWADSASKRWAVSPDGIVYTYDDPTTPRWHIQQGHALGVSREPFASTLHGRYRNAAGAFATLSVTDADAAARFLLHEETVDLTGAGALADAKVTSILTGMLAKGRARFGWTSSLEVTQAELMSAGGVPVDVHTVSAPGSMVRQHNLWDDTRSLHGQLYTDVILGGTRHKQGSRTVELMPLQLEPVSVEDLIASIPKG